MKRTQVEAELYELLEYFVGKRATPDVVKEMQEILVNYLREDRGLPPLAVEIPRTWD